MPSTTLGWTRDETVSKVLDTLGRTGDATLQARLQEDINIAQIGFWKLFDWKWGYKKGVEDNLYLILVPQQNIYILDPTTINSGFNFTGYELRNTNIDKVYTYPPPFSPSPRTLTKVSSREIRQADPGNINIGFPEMWAPYQHNGVEFWPLPGPESNGMYIHFDGKVLPKYMSNGSDYPDIPIEHQETFQQYLLVRALGRERSSRQAEEIQILKDMVLTDKRMDMAEVESNLRMHWPEEEFVNSSGYPSLVNVKQSFWNDF